MKRSTWLTKESIIRSKIIPYLGQRKVSEITAKDVIDWQNAMRKLKNKSGKPIAPTYLKTIHGQLSAIFNHAMKFYDLAANPAQKAGTMGAEESKEMEFWTKEEYLKFSEAMMDKPLSYYAFELLYWCGVREGELLALSPSALGKLIHYTTDAFTYAHNDTFPTQLSDHCLYEQKLQEHFLTYLKDVSPVRGIFAKNVIEAIETYHNSYEKQQPGIHTDSHFALAACCCVLSILV